MQSATPKNLTINQNIHFIIDIQRSTLDIKIYLIIYKFNFETP